MTLAAASDLKTAADVAFRAGDYGKALEVRAPATRPDPTIARRRSVRASNPAITKR